MSSSSFGFETPEDSPGFLLWQTTVLWQRAIKKALDVYHIAHAQFVVLANTLWFEEHQQTPTQIMIVRMSKLDKMTVSKALKKLVNDGLVGRVENSLDTRAKSISLTPQGKQLTITLIARVEAVDETYFSGISTQERQQLLGLFSKLIGRAAVNT
ncbi:MAG: MarR family transcriptional regulator [Coxiella sp. (in: Bacteria)]|nr:MAG: MarR family transcriptional regulator [Coxiella sp. (in: g-proteobacteria)]